MLTGLIGWILFAAVVGVGANTRGRNGFGWFALSVAISPLVSGLFLIALPRRKAEKDPFADVATLAAIETTPEGSRSRQLLAEHEAKRAAKIKTNAADAAVRRDVALVIVVILLGLFIYANVPWTSQQASVPVKSASSAASIDLPPPDHPPMICGIAGPC